MKTIIVAVDFSKWSNYAIKYAIKIANIIGADIQMVWVDKSASMKSVYPNPKLNYIQEVKNKFEEIISKNEKKLTKGRLEYKIRKGKVYEEVVNQAKYSDAAMIIAGTHGASGFEEFWIGSNAYKIVAASTCPVITIRDGYCYLESTSKILLPIDSTIETRQKVPFSAKFAKAIGAEIIVLSLYSSSVKEIKDSVDNYTKQTTKFLNDENVKYSTDKIQVVSNVSDTVLKYVKDYKMDIVSIMTEQETSAASLWLGSSAQRIVNHCPIPVLSFHTQSIFDITSR
jgi:nucleotide-binding universal stress UspA family protein